MIPEYKCDAVIKDPFYNGKICNSPAKWKIKLEKTDEYKIFRCGKHTYKYDKVLINDNKKKNNYEPLNFNFVELLKYIESDDIKNDIPEEIKNLYNSLDDLNSYINNIIV